MTRTGAVALPAGAKDTRLINTASGKNRNTENFPVGSTLIRPDLRGHVHAFYNFARAADDIADHPLLEPSDKIARLNHFAQVLVNQADDLPVVVAMRESLNATHITTQHCLDLLTAFKRDATQLRYASWDDLIDYCRYSASPVGRQVLALHGIGDSAWLANDSLCSVLQVINHIQDCADDYRELDRVYLPQDMLAATGASTADLSRVETTEALRSTFNAMIKKMDAMMPLARDLPRKVPDLRLKIETSVICVLAEKLIHVLRRRDPLCDNVKLSKPSIAGAGILGVLRAWT